MTALQSHYSQLHEEALKHIAREGFSYDTALEDPKDNRRGLTLLLRPDEELKASFGRFITAVKTTDPDQYFYPPADIHVTIMPIISCYPGFNKESLDLSGYISLIRKALKPVRKMQIRFEGVMASPSCLLIRGFPVNSELEHCRENLRAAFATTHLEQSLDKRYKLITAHSTVIRFRQKVNQPEKILDILEQFKDCFFGEQVFDQVEFVFNDWYQRNEMVKTLQSFPLKH
ncbi:2'-5' RNA ligase family protein [Cyclobacterium plantarum]|uniref:Mutarotase n=1 Tax=Cyclobacterium plantarum TaxID=2716263 RepID=A0ABX0HFS9_9BACT|nr:hypothetical protein [Cyclobacterium plantarum]NHE58895.1 hypothetical protein [Cyclobacterium plantarum]